MTAVSGVFVWDLEKIAVVVGAGPKTQIKADSDGRLFPVKKRSNTSEFAGLGREKGQMGWRRYGKEEIRESEREKK